MALPHHLIITGSGFDAGEFFYGCNVDITDGPPGSGSRGLAPGEDALSTNFNRAAFALAENDEYMHTMLTRDIASPEVGVLTGHSGTTIVIDPSGDNLGDVNYTGTLYLGETLWSGQERLDQLFQLLDEDYNEVVVFGTEAKVTSLGGGSLGGGFVATAVTLNLNVTLPSGNYRIGYYIGTNIGELPPYALSLAGLRGLEELPGEDRPASRVIYDGTTSEWRDGTPHPTATVQEQLDKTIMELAADAGAVRVGAAPQSSDFEPMGSGSIGDQIATLTARLDAMEKRDAVVRGTNLSTIALGLSGSPNMSSIAVGRKGTSVGSNDSEKVYVIVGGRGTAGPGFIGTATNLDGTWTSRAPGGSPTDIYGVAWGMGAAANGSWQAVGNNGAGNGAWWGYSTEGVASWSEVASYPTGWDTGNYNLHDVVYEPVSGRFVAVGHDGGGNSIVGWNIYTILNTPTTAPAVPALTRIATDGAGNLMACGTDGAGNNGLTRSTDGGSNWTDISTSLPFVDIAWEPRRQRWIALSNHGTVNRFYVSDDSTGTTGWTQVTSFDEASSLATDGRGLVLVTGNNGALHGQIRWSTDLGASWSFATLLDSTYTNDADDFGRFATLRYIDGRFIQIVQDETAAGTVIWKSLRQDSDIVGAVV